MSKYITIYFLGWIKFVNENKIFVAIPSGTVLFGNRDKMMQTVPQPNPAILASCHCLVVAFLTNTNTQTRPNRFIWIYELLLTTMIFYTMIQFIYHKTAKCKFKHGMFWFGMVW